MQNIIYASYNKQGNTLQQPQPIIQKYMMLTISSVKAVGGGKNTNTEIIHIFCLYEEKIVWVKKTI